MGIEDENRMPVMYSAGRLRVVDNIHQVRLSNQLCPAGVGMSRAACDL